VSHDIGPLSPQTVLTHVMAAATEVLGDHIAPEHGFFSAGGDSVAAVWIADVLEERLGVEVDVVLVINAESFNDLARQLAQVPGAAEER
jgi:acyl carrier protein